MEDELSSNRVYMKPDHTLVFNRTIEDDAALYYCSGRLGEDQNFKYNYLVDSWYLIYIYLFLYLLLINFHFSLK